MKDKPFPKVHYEECHHPDKMVIAGVCFKLGMLGAAGKCGADEYTTLCDPYQEYLKELHKEE